ncbi:hypothetical protein [Marinifilum fragile]|uniref:hypothetical protein n=1 Tax=Marinifilum fragile TaxID=570161 RepID=UPI002AA948EB|nr:hypothetical protein [Marinifilum fragile]
MNDNKVAASESTINKGLQKGIKKCPLKNCNPTLHLSGQRDLWKTHHLNALVMPKKEKQKRQEIIKISFFKLKVAVYNPSWKSFIVLAMVLTFIALMVKL